MPPQLSERTPRLARMTIGTQRTRFFLTALLVGVVWLVAWLGWRDVHDLKALFQHGVPATAKVYDKRERHGKSTTHYLDYQFETPQDEVTDSEDVSSSNYAETQIGDTLPVTYLPADPATHRVGTVDEERVSNRQVAWTLGTLATLAVLGLIVWAKERDVRNHLMLLSEGETATGTVTDRRTQTGKYTTYYITYEFAEPAKKSLHRNTVSVSSILYEQSIPGLTLTILFDRYRPANNYPYQSLSDVELT